MGRREDAEKMPFEGLDTAFCGVRSFLVGWDGVMDDVLGREEIKKSSRGFVVEDLNFEMVAELTEEEVGCEVSGAEMGSRARDKGFDVNVSFVDREQQIFREVLGGDVEAAWEIREDSISSEL